MKRVVELPVAARGKTAMCSSCLMGTSVMRHIPSLLLLWQKLAIAVAKGLPLRGAHGIVSILFDGGVSLATHLSLAAAMVDKRIGISFDVM